MNPPNMRRINILMYRDGATRRFGWVTVGNDESIYLNIGSKNGLWDNFHDSVHPSGELHRGKTRKHRGYTELIMKPMNLTVPWTFTSTTQKFGAFPLFKSTIQDADIVLACPSDIVTHPVIGVYLEPANKNIVSRRFQPLRTMIGG